MPQVKISYPALTDPKHWKYGVADWKMATYDLAIARKRKEKTWRGMMTLLLRRTLAKLIGT